jgi:parallel beta-helix repeat protein
VNNEMVNGGSTGYGLSISASAISIGPSATRNPTIKGNLFSGNVTGAAVWPVMEHGDISDNRFVGNGVYHGFQGTPKSTVIARNSFNDNQLNGMNLVGSPSNNIITENEFAGNHAQGLAGTLESTVVARNSFRDNQGNGIGGGTAGSVTIRDNEFRSNALSGVAGNYYNSTIEGNLFIDNGAFGIQLFTPVHDTTITGNLMLRNGLTKPCVDPRLNDCGGGIEFGARSLVAQQPQTNHVYGNTISGNRFGAYYASIATSPPAPAPGDFATLEIPMAGNYWGTTSGPFHPVRNVSGTGNAAYDRQATDASAPGKILFYPWLMLAPGDTPRKLSQAAAADLNALLPTGNKQTDDRIGKAINSILDSMKPSYWAGDFALTGKGSKVFDEDRKAVNELQHVTKAAGATVAAVKESIEDLVVADEVLARAAIWAAVDGNGKPAEIAKARDEFTKAVAYQTAGNWDNAVDHFKKAWEHATRAL